MRKAIILSAAALASLFAICATASRTGEARVSKGCVGTSYAQPACSSSSCSDDCCDSGGCAGGSCGGCLMTASAPASCGSGSGCARVCLR